MKKLIILISLLGCFLPSNGHAQYAGPVSKPTHFPLAYPTLNYPANHQLFVKVQTVNPHCQAGRVDGKTGVTGENYLATSADFSGQLNQWIEVPVPINVDVESIKRLFIVTEATADCSEDAAAEILLSTRPDSSADQSSLGTTVFLSTPVSTGDSPYSFKFANHILMNFRFEVAH